MMTKKHFAAIAASFASERSNIDCYKSEEPKRSDGRLEISFLFVVDSDRCIF